MPDPQTPTQRGELIRWTWHEKAERELRKHEKAQDLQRKDEEKKKEKKAKEDEPRNRKRKEEEDKLATHVTVVLVLHNFHTMLSCLRRFENHLCTAGAFAHVKNLSLCMLVAEYLHL